MIVQVVLNTSEVRDAFNEDMGPQGYLVPALMLACVETLWLVTFKRLISGALLQPALEVLHFLRRIGHTPCDATVCCVIGSSPWHYSLPPPKAQGEPLNQ